MRFRRRAHRLTDRRCFVLHNHWCFVSSASSVIVQVHIAFSFLRCRSLCRRCRFSRCNRFFHFCFRYRFSCFCRSFCCRFLNRFCCFLRCCCCFFRRSR